MFATCMLLWLLFILALEVSYFFLFGWRGVSYYNNDKNLFLYRKSAIKARRRQGVQHDEEQRTSTTNNVARTKQGNRSKLPFFGAHTPVKKYGRNNSVSPNHSAKSISSSRPSTSEHVVINFEKNNDLSTSKNGSARSSISGQRSWLTHLFTVP